MTKYVAGKLDQGRLGQSPFPILCPACGPEPGWALTEDVVEKLVQESVLQLWRYHVYLESFSGVSKNQYIFVVSS